jgi:Domain of unknown function (DUF4333)
MRWLAIVAILFLFGLSACSSENGEPGPEKKVLDESALESSNGVAKILVDEYHVSPPISVDCPPNQDAKSGNTFTCSVKIDGKDWGVDIKVLDDKGTYEVGTPRER